MLALPSAEAAEASSVRASFTFSVSGNAFRKSLSVAIRSVGSTTAMAFSHSVFSSEAGTFSAGSTFRATGFGFFGVGFVGPFDLTVLDLAVVDFGFDDVAFAFEEVDGALVEVDFDLLAPAFGFDAVGFGFGVVVLGFVVCGRAAIAATQTKARTGEYNLINRAKNFIICPKSYHEIAFSYRKPYSRSMTELDQIWSKMLIDAGQRASDAGRHEIAEYLRLRASNDAIRSAGVSWLFDTVAEIATREMRSFPAVNIERDEPHRFALGNSTMIGSVIRIRLGVRCMTVEAGWARTPSDGIMVKGALAQGRISHFGMPKEGVQLRFLHVASLPEWVNENGEAIDAEFLRGHFEKLMSM